MAERMEEKDSHMNNINRLNKEMTQLNNTIVSQFLYFLNIEIAAAQLTFICSYPYPQASLSTQVSLRRQ